MVQLQHKGWQAANGYNREMGRESMPKTLSKPVDAEEIAEMADREQDVSTHFTNQFTVVRPTAQRVNGADEG